MNTIKLYTFYDDLQFVNFIQLTFGRAPTKLYKFG